MFIEYNLLGIVYNLHDISFCIFFFFSHLVLQLQDFVLSLDAFTSVISVPDSPRVNKYSLLPLEQEEGCRALQNCPSLFGHSSIHFLYLIYQHPAPTHSLTCAHMYDMTYVLVLIL